MARGSKAKYTGGRAQARRPAAARSRSARKAAATRKRRRSPAKRRRKTGLSRWFS